MPTVPPHPSLPSLLCSYIFCFFKLYLPRFSHFYPLVLCTAELICPVKFFLSFIGLANSSESWNCFHSFTLCLNSSFIRNQVIIFLLSLFPSLFKNYHKNSYQLKKTGFEVPFHTMGGRNQTEIHYST